MSDELVIFGTPFPNIENDNKNYIPVWKQKVCLKLNNLFLIYNARPYLRKVINGSMEHLKVAFPQAILIVWGLRKDGNRLNLYLVVKIDILNLQIGLKIIWMKRI